MAERLPVYGSQEWHDRNAEEIANRPKPLPMDQRQVSYGTPDRSMPKTHDWFPKGSS